MSAVGISCVARASVLAGAALPGRSALAAALPLGQAGRPWSAVADLGAVGDGRTDGWRSLRDRLRVRRRPRLRRRVGRVVIEIPAGEFLITRPHALLNGVAPPRPRAACGSLGAGRRIDQPRVPGPGTGPNTYLCRNQGVWSNLSLRTHTVPLGHTGASFFDSYSTGQAQGLPVLRVRVDGGVGVRARPERHGHQLGDAVGGVPGRRPVPQGVPSTRG
ncbi:hypothetical protein LT493_12400 [Streptomyces tricolor]|nr:hypothetical protein [Streptomyces tricolor]